MIGFNIGYIGTPPYELPDDITQISDKIKNSSQKTGGE